MSPWELGMLALGSLPPDPYLSSSALLCISVGSSCGLCFPGFPLSWLSFWEDLGGGRLEAGEGRGRGISPCLSASGSVSSSHCTAPGLQVLLDRPLWSRFLQCQQPNGSGGFLQLLIAVL